MRQRNSGVRPTRCGLGISRGQQQMMTYGKYFLCMGLCAGLQLVSPHILVLPFTSPLQSAKIFSKARNDDGRSMGFAHVDFESKEPAIKANRDHEESPMMIGDREIRMNHAFPYTHKGGPPLPRRAIKERREPAPTIFVGNLPYEATKDDIREALKPLGEVVAVRVCALPRSQIIRTACSTQVCTALSKEGNPKGFAHVDFTTTAEAEEALKRYQHNPVHILGQEVRLDRSTPAEKAYPPSPRLYFTKWEGNASSLRSYFRALRSKIVDIHVCTLISALVLLSNNG